MKNSSFTQSRLWWLICLGFVLLSVLPQTPFSPNLTGKYLDSPTSPSYLPLKMSPGTSVSISNYLLIVIGNVREEGQS